MRFIALAPKTFIFLFPRNPTACSPKSNTLFSQIQQPVLPNSKACFFQIKKTVSPNSTACFPPPNQKTSRIQQPVSPKSKSLFSPNPTACFTRIYRPSIFNFQISFQISHFFRHDSPKNDLIVVMTHLHASLQLFLPATITLPSFLDERAATPIRGARFATPRPALSSGTRLSGGEFQPNSRPRRQNQFGELVAKGRCRHTDFYAPPSEEHLVFVGSSSPSKRKLFIAEVTSDDDTRRGKRVLCTHF